MTSLTDEQLLDGYRRQYVENTAEITRLRALAVELAIALLMHRGCSMFAFDDEKRQHDEAVLAKARAAGLLGGQQA